MKVRTEVIVKGRVQGVAFRHHTARAAAQHGVTGWVLNLPDGSVKACFEGEESAVRSMVEWCRRGPEMAQVVELVEQPGAYSGDFTGFNIRYSDE